MGRITVMIVVVVMMMMMMVMVMLILEKCCNEGGPHPLDIQTIGPPPLEHGG